MALQNFRARALEGYEVEITINIAPDDDRVELFGVEPGRRQMVFTPPGGADQFGRSVIAYHAGAMIQDAFGYLNDDEREFLLTGLLPGEFPE